MIMVKSIFFGILSLVVGSWIGIIIALVVGYAVETILTKYLSESVLKKYRYIWGHAWMGFTIGIINSTMIYFFKMNGWVLILIFIIYIVIFLGKRNASFVLNSICASNEKQFNKLLAIDETITFGSHILGLYGLWTILTKWN